MWNLCLDVSNHPKIQIKLSQPIEIGAGEREIPATISLRGEEYPLTLKVKLDSEMAADITGKISIKELKIPDPSIAIASVRDSIDISAHIIIKDGNPK